MPKIKTHKATSKRFRITKSKKVIHKKAGQDHYNARETGKVGRNKRREMDVDKTIEKTIRTLLPYN